MCKFWMSKLWILAIALLLVNGCAYNALSFNDSDEQNEVVLSAEDVKAFNQNKARLDEFTSLNSDLMLLLDELSKHSKVDEKPSRFRRNSTEQHIQPSFSVLDDVEEANKKSTGKNSTPLYTAVLGRYLNEQRAVDVANTIEQHFNITSLNMPFGIGINEEKPGYSTIFLGNFRSDKVAALLCQAFMKRNQFCAVEANMFSAEYLLNK